MTAERMTPQRARELTEAAHAAADADRRPVVHGPPLPSGPVIQCGDDATADAYLSEAAAAANRQRVRYALAPRANLTLPDGRTLGQGDTLAPDDLEGARLKRIDSDGEPRIVEVSARAALHHLIINGWVLERGSQPVRPARPA